MNDTAISDLAFTSSGAPPKVLPSTSDSRPWAYTTARFRSLGLDAQVRTTDPALGGYLDHAYRDIAVPGRAATTYSVVTRGPGTWPFVLYRGRDRLSFSPDGRYVVEHLLWDLNRMVVRTDRELLLHAGAVERGGIGIVLPAATGAGKTTLTAGLVRAGARYLSDEVAAVEPGTLTLQPHPSPLVIEEGSWPVLDGLRPGRRDLLPAYVSGRWHVPASTIRADALGRPVRPGLIIAPHYVPGSPTLVQPMSRANMIVHLAAQTFGPDRGAWTLERLRDLVSISVCYRLNYPELGVACDAVARLTQAVLEEGDR